MATGVLLVCLGRATRVAEYLVGCTKVYQASIRLGSTTDTYDAEGQVVATQRVDVTRADVEATLARFRGPILQVPPMYSAIKRDGKPLYKLARQGITVERPPRSVEIYSLEMTAWQPPDLTLELHCSSGTYVRSLAHDLGQVLGCGGHLTGLVRTAVGDFRLENAVPLDELGREELPALLHPIDAALRQYPAFHLDEDTALAVCAGRGFAAPAAEESIARAYAPDGTLIAVLTFRSGEGIWHPRKVFLPSAE
jgi:tRNA pseudouridine55 synthase